MLTGLDNLNAPAIMGVSRNFLCHFIRDGSYYSTPYV